MIKHNKEGSMKNMYYRLTSTLNSKGKLIPCTENVFKYITNKDIDHYMSVYLYNQEQKNIFYKEVEKENEGVKYKTINGAGGLLDVVTNRLIFDFDSEDLELAKNDTKAIIKTLLSYNISQDSIQVFFSGSKGFHVVVFLEDILTPLEHKKIAEKLAEGLKSFDSKVYNASRILRVPFTKHPDTGLYKIPIELDELDVSIDNILHWAKDEYNPEEYLAVHTPTKLSNKIMELLEDTKTEIQEINNIDINWNEKPSYLSNWKFALSRGYFPQGCRNYALMILAATYRGLKKNKTETYYLLKAAADLQSQRTGQERYSKEEIWVNIINVVYNPNWMGGTYSEDNFPSELIEYFEEHNIPRNSENNDQELIEKIETGFDNFIEYAKHINEYTMKFGLEALDEKLKVRKGHLIYILGSPGTGKTSCAITMLNNMSKQGIHCYFASYDMYSMNVYQKLTQRHTGLSEEELYEEFINNNVNKIEEFKNILIEEYKNVTFCFKSGQTISDLKKSIRKQEEKTGNLIELVIVDYTELILTNSSDPTAASAEAAQGLRELANEGRVVVGLLQPNKASSKPDEPLLSYNNAKGSASIAQSASAMLTVHRPGLDSRNNNIDDNYFSINCVKNRNGSLFALDYGWHGSTQTLYELDDIQKENLKALRDRKKSEGLEEL